MSHHESVFLVNSYIELTVCFALLHRVTLDCFFERLIAKSLWENLVPETIATENLHLIKLAEHDTEAGHHSERGKRAVWLMLTNSSVFVKVNADIVASSGWADVPQEAGACAEL